MPDALTISAHAFDRAKERFGKSFREVRDEVRQSRFVKFIPHKAKMYVTPCGMWLVVDGRHGVVTTIVTAEMSKAIGNGMIGRKRKGKQ